MPLRVAPGGHVDEYSLILFQTFDQLQGFFGLITTDEVDTLGLITSEDFVTRIAELKTTLSRDAKGGGEKMGLKGGGGDEVVRRTESLRVIVDFFETGFLVSLTEGATKDIILDALEPDAVPKINAYSPTGEAVEDIGSVGVEEPILGGEGVPHALRREEVIGFEPMAPDQPDGGFGAAYPGDIDVRTMLAGVNEQVLGIVVKGSCKTAKGIFAFIPNEEEREGIEDIAEGIV